MLLRNKGMRLQGRYITFHTVTKMLRMDERKKDEKKEERNRQWNKGVSLFFSYWRHPVVLYYFPKYS